MHSAAVLAAALALAVGGGDHAKTQQALTNLDNVVVNVRSFDGIAGRIFGKGFGVSQLSGSLARVNKDSSALSKLLKNGGTKTQIGLAQTKLSVDIVKLEKQGALVRLKLANAIAFISPSGQALASDLIHSLATNLSLLHQANRTIAKSLGG
jgi:hypothetical protein